MRAVIPTSRGFIIGGFSLHADTADVADRFTTTLWASEDGVAWSPVDATGLDGSSISSSAVLTDGTIYAAGSIGFCLPGLDCSDADRAVWRSENGRDWQRVDEDEDFGGHLPLEVFAAAGQVFASALADGDTETMWRSEDGSSWQEVALPTPLSAIRSITTAPFGLMAAGSGTGDRGLRGVVLTSDDGTTWRRVDEGELPARRIGGIAGTGDTAIVFGTTVEGLDVIWRSEDGARWTTLDLSTVFAVSEIDFVTSIPNAVVVATSPVRGASGPVVWTSTDGEVWLSSGPDGVAPPRHLSTALGASENGVVLALETVRGDHDPPAAGLETHIRFGRWTMAADGRKIVTLDEIER